MSTLDVEVEPFFNFRNVLILLGIIITAIGLIYFATAFGDIISDWGRVLDLTLLTVIYVSLGIHFSTADEAGPVIARRGWRWMRVTSALYVLGLTAGFSAVMAFLFGLPDLSRVVKLLALVIAGLMLIFVAARFVKQRPMKRPPEAP